MGVLWKHLESALHSFSPRVASCPTAMSFHSIEFPFTIFEQLPDGVAVPNFVKLENEDLGSEEYYPFELLQHHVQTSCDKVVAGKAAKDWQAVLDKPIFASEAKACFAATATDHRQRVKSKGKRVITLPQVPAMGEETRPTMDTIVRWLSTLQSETYYEGVFRVVNIRTARSHRDQVLTITGKGQLFVQESLSKDPDKVNLVDPLNGTSKAYQFEREAEKLEKLMKKVHLDANSPRFLGRCFSSVREGDGIPTVEDQRPVEEAIVVLFDLSESMKRESVLPGTSRLELAKHCLRSFLDRLAAYNYPFRVQLMTFAFRIDVVCPFTSIYARFSKHLDDLYTGGSTALYSALHKAVYQLTSTFPDPATKRRIFVLSDGEDSISFWHTALSVICEARNADIVIDSMCIGEDARFYRLKAITLLTGGLCLKAPSLEEMFHTFESEPLLSIHCRPVPKPCLDIATEQLTDSHIVQVGDTFEFSTIPRKPFPEQIQARVTSASERIVAEMRCPSSSAGAHRAMLKALALYQRSQHPAVRLFPTLDVLSFWLFTLRGPAGTPYAAGTFVGYIELPSRFPRNPPIVRMITPMYHCNINSDGKVCHSVLDRNWDPSYSIKFVMDCLYGLLLSPEPDDPLDTNIASLYYNDKAAYEAKAAACTAKYALDVRGTLRHVGEAVDFDLPSFEATEHPKHLVDPISGVLMEDPVICPSGETFSRASAEEWICTHGTDPGDKQTPIDVSRLIPNKAIATEITRYQTDLVRAAAQFGHADDQ
eukprot:m.3702 g.3702  ORF g.3702 m.3702 type:complete len:766 (+) comp4289_c0_seq1:700-2997(+)